MTKDETIKQMKRSTSRFKKSKYETLKFRHTRAASLVQDYKDEWEKASSKNWLFRKYYLLHLQEEVAMHVWGILLTIILAIVMSQLHPQIMAIEILAKYSTIVDTVITSIVFAPLAFAIYVFFSAEKEFFYYAGRAVESEQRQYEALREEALRLRGEKK